MTTLSVGSPSTPNATILLVDDNCVYRDMTEMALTSLGYCVQPCSCPNEALERVASSPLLKLLITDVIMSKMNGVQLANEIRGRRPDIKVLFCSGYPAVALTRQGLDVTSGEFLMKPVSLSALSSKIELLIGVESRAA